MKKRTRAECKASKMMGLSLCPSSGGEDVLKGWKLKTKDFGSRINLSTVKVLHSQVARPQRDRSKCIRAKAFESAQKEKKR